MLPFGHGSDEAMSAVIALEGSGRGRFVYHLTDGRTHQGGYVEWPDVDQSIGNGSFHPPETTTNT
jgi:hypothetical protein